MAIQSHCLYFVANSSANATRPAKNSPEDAMKRMADIIAKRDAMIEAMVETHKLLLSIQLNDIFEDAMRNHACLAIEKLKPFIP